MLHTPVTGDTYYDPDSQPFTLAYYDKLQALLNPHSMSGGEIGLHLSEDAFQDKVSNGELRPAYSQHHEVNILTEYQKKELRKREPYITELSILFKQGCKPTTNETINKLKAIVLEKYHIGTSKHGNKTIARWWKDYTDAEYIFDKSVSPRKNQPTRTSLASENFLNNHFSDTWVKGNIENESAGYRAYKNAVEKAQLQNDAIELLSESTFKRRLKELNSFNVILNSGNYSKVKKALRTLCKKIKTTRVLERVEMDRMELNLALIDEEGKPTGNVSIYIVLDCHSRYPLSVTFELGMSEDTEGAVRSFKRMFSKTSDELSAHGIPTKVIVDNGSGYKSEVLKQIVQRIGGDLIKAPSVEPWRKPFVESFIRTLRVEFFEGGEFETPDGKTIVGLPGFKAKRTAKTAKPPSDETIKKAATLTIEEFASLIHDYLVHYVTQPHSGLRGKTPQQVWNESVSKIPLIPINEEKLYMACHYLEARPNLQERGTVQANKQVFFDRRLKQCYLDAKTLNPDQDMSVVVKYDPDDARWVTVIANFTCFDKPKVFERVENRALSGVELDYPQSFEELNVKEGTTKRRDIFSRKINNLIKQTTKPPGNGKSIESANKNASKGLSVTERIKKSNESYAFKPTNQAKKQKNESTSLDTSKSKKKVNKDLRVNQQTFKWDD